jgi:hypothetical protein
LKLAGFFLKLAGFFLKLAGFPSQCKFSHPQLRKITSIILTQPPISAILVETDSQLSQFLNEASDWILW